MELGEGKHLYIDLIYFGLKELKTLVCLCPRRISMGLEGQGLLLKYDDLDKNNGDLLGVYGFRAPIDAIQLSVFKGHEREDQELASSKNDYICLIILLNMINYSQPCTL
ncbi:hypothetical protein ACJX0J_019591, partial [Zea mays]